MSTLYVVRHAQASMFAANYDELSELGRGQARTLGRVWAQRWAAAGRSGFDAVFSGPAQRHRDTAALVAEGFVGAGIGCSEPDVIAGFDEHDGQGLVMKVLEQVGVLDEPLRVLAANAIEPSTDRRERSRAWQLVYEATMRRWLTSELEFDGIETWPQFHARVLEAFADVRERSRGEVVVFTSVGPTAVILLEVLGLTPAQAFELGWRVYNTAVTRIVYGGGRVTLDGFNDVSHLGIGDQTYR